MNSSEKNTELISIWVTPQLKKDFEDIKDSQKLKERLIKELMTDEKDWFKREIEEMDESVVRYNAKLITFKDKLSETNNIYVDKMSGMGEAIYENVQDFNSILDTKLKEVESSLKPLLDSLDSMKYKVVALNSLASSSGFRDLERAINCLEKFKELSEEESDILKLIISKK